MNKVSSLEVNFQADAVSMLYELACRDFVARILVCSICSPVYYRVPVTITVSIVKVGDQVLSGERRTHWRRSIDGYATFKLLQKIRGLVDSHLNKIVIYFIVACNPISSDDNVFTSARLLYLYKP